LRIIANGVVRIDCVLAVEIGRRRGVPVSDKGGADFIVAHGYLLAEGARAAAGPRGDPLLI
jgi:hypothetical protein